MLERLKALFGKSKKPEEIDNKELWIRIERHDERMEKLIKDVGKLLNVKLDRIEDRSTINFDPNAFDKKVLKKLDASGTGRIRVKDMSSTYKKSRTYVSSRLNLMVKAGILEIVREGKTVFYQKVSEF